MIAVQSGKTNIGRWTTEKRNIKEDYKRFFGTEVKYVDAVAIMADADNSGQQASAMYGDIYFTEC